MLVVIGQVQCRTGYLLNQDSIQKGTWPARNVCAGRKPHWRSHKIAAASENWQGMPGNHPTIPAFGLKMSLTGECLSRQKRQRN